MSILNSSGVTLIIFFCLMYILVACFGRVCYEEGMDDDGEAPFDYV